MKVVLDTNFIIYCLKKKIDIEEELKKLNEDPYLEIIILSSILEELERFSKDKEKKLIERNLAKVFLEMIKERKINVNIVSSNQKNPDEAIKVFCSKNPDVLLASYDKELKKKIKNNFLVIKGNRIFLA
ncbi:MAG: PIN domain-containing protein [Candidatus Pacearchaeota archaeon]